MLTAELPSYVVDAGLNGAAEAILISDMSVSGAPLCFVSDAFVALTGYSKEEAIGRSCSYLQGSDRDQQGIKAIRQAIEMGEPVEVTLRNYRKDGSLFYNRLRLKPVRANTGVVSHFIGFLRDVSDLYGAQQAIQRLSTLDPTTDLLNRGAFTEEIQRVNRSGSPGIAVIKIDAVRFHDINSGYGYQLGDRLLRDIAVRLRSMSAFAVGRLGANEFALAFQVASRQDADKVAQDTLQLLQEPFRLEGNELSVRFASGYAFAPAGGDVVLLIRNAATALHRSKRSGVKSMQTFSGDDEVESRRRIQLTAQLKTALERDEFLLHYQPKVDLANSRIVGAEALIRWLHPTLGVQPPSVFITHAEDVGLIGDIDAWSLRAAARFCKRLNGSRPESIPISVNLSGHEISQAQLLERIVGICAEEELDPRLLTLELTETVMVTADNEVLRNMNDLRERGFGISIDDFGTGYSSLSYLDRFPISEIKLDRTFVKGIEQNSTNQVIVDSIVKIGAAAGLDIVAEGIETQDELTALKQLACPIGQGYLLGRPEDGDRFLARV